MSLTQTQAIITMPWNDDLTEPYLTIAGSSSRRIGVLAGPGTGKTWFGLMRRVARLIEDGVSPSRILLLSFTRTAASDLRAKVADLGVPGAENIVATTLHSYCYGLLRREAVLAITRRVPRPLLEHEVDMMLRDLLASHGILDERRELLHAFEAAWARGTADHPGLAEPSDREFEVAVLKWLRHHKGMLIGEVVPIAYNYLRNNPSAAEHGRFEHIIVDEYQDLNTLEQRLLDLLAEPASCSMCIAGDDDQSIYGFRYANPAGINSYLAADDVEDITIDTCDRCAPNILAMANELIAHAPHRTKGPLFSRRDVNGVVKVVQWADLDEEIEGLAGAIATFCGPGGSRSAGDILVLVHRQKIGELLRKRLTELAIPAHSYFSQEAVGTTKARWALAILRLAVADDPIALRVILGLDDAGARAPAYGRLHGYAVSEGRNEREVLEALAAGERLSLRVPALVSRFETALAEAAALPRDDIPAAIDRLLPDDGPDVSDLRQIALAEAPDADDLAQLCERIIGRVTQQDIPEHPDFVRIMSLHKSKGLSSPVVVLAGMIDGIVPTIKSTATPAQADEARDEQRRLTYVAVTRAKEELIISSSVLMEFGVASSLGAQIVRSRVRRVSGQLMAPTIASPYLAEMSSSAPRAIRGVDWLRNI